MPKHTSRLFSRFFIFFILSLTNSVYALSIHVEQDAYTSTYNTNKNYGDRETGRICNLPPGRHEKHEKGEHDHDDHSNGGKCSTYLGFDLSGLPKGLKVTSASLRIWVSKVKSAGDIDMNLLLDDWSENSLTAAMSPVMGNLVHSKQINKSDEQHYIVIDVADVVQSWVDDASGNHGLVLSPGVSDNKVNIYLDTKENKETSHPAELEVLFSDINIGDLKDRIQALEDSLSKLTSVIQVDSNAVSINGGPRNLLLYGNNIISHASALYEIKGATIHSLAAYTNKTTGSSVESRSSGLNIISGALIKLN